MNAETINIEEGIVNFLQNCQNREYDLPDGGLESLAAFCVAQGFVLSRDGYVYNPAESDEYGASLLENSGDLEIWARDRGFAVYDRRSWLRSEHAQFMAGWVEAGGPVPNGTMGNEWDADIVSCIVSNKQMFYPAGLSLHELGKAVFERKSVQEIEKFAEMFAR